MNRKGSLLIITLWMVTILSTFAIAIARYLSVELRITRYRAARAQAEAMARSGVYVAMAKLKADSTTYDWISDPDWALVQGDAVNPAKRWELWSKDAIVDTLKGLTGGSRFLVQITDEQSKVPINKLSQLPLDPVVLAAVKYYFGSDLLAAKVVDYVDSDVLPCSVSVCGADGVERDDPLRPAYFSKNTAVRSFGELLTIPGIDAGISALAPDKLEALLDAFSFYPQDETININTVSKEVLAALGVNAARDKILEYQQKDDNTLHHDDQALTDLVVQLTTDVWQAQPVFDAERLIVGQMGTASEFFTVESTGESALTIGKGQPTVKAHVQAVVRRGQKCVVSGMPDPCILAWNEW